MCELGSEAVIWARNVPDWRTGGPGFLEPLGTVLARWSPLTVLGLVGGRGHGTSVTGLGPPIRPFIGVHSWAVGLPEGSHSEAGLGTAGAAGTGPRAGQHKGEPQRHLHVKGGWAFTASCLGPLKHICWAQRGPSLFAGRRKEAGWASAQGSLIKQFPPGTNGPATHPSSVRQEPRDPVKTQAPPSRS